MLAGLALLQGAVLLAVFMPDGRPIGLRLPTASDAATMARALEAAPDEVRPLLVEALSHGPMTVRLAHSAPQTEIVETPTRLRRLARRYEAALEGRKVTLALEDTRPEGGRRTVKLLVRLRTGEWLVTYRTPELRRRIRERGALFAGAALAVMALVLAVSLRTVRPVGALAMTAYRLAEDVRSPDLPVRGVREVRALSAALNDLKRRVGALLDERTRMLAAIAHDLRTYLTRLRLRAEFIGDEEQRTRALRDLEEMGRLIEDAMVFARAATGEGQADGQEVVEVAAVVADLTARRGESAEGITLSDAPEGLYARLPDLVLRRMLDNLIDNALRYAGNVHIALAGEPEAVIVTLSDEGPGIPDDKLEQVLQPFARLEPSRGRTTGGAGLGLAIVQALAESHGATLEIRNRPEGGLMSTIRLPRA